MATAIADTEKPRRGWSSAMCQSTIDDVSSDVVEAVVTVNADRGGVNVIGDVTSILRKHNANVISGYGCRLKRVSGGQFYIEAPRDQIKGIQDEIDKEFASRSRPVTRKEDFHDVKKYVPTHEIVVFVKHNRTGVLADAFGVMAKSGVNVVTVAAGAGPTLDGDSWGRAIITAYIEGVDAFWDAFVAVAKEEAWDEVKVTPIRTTGQPYAWTNPVVD